MEYDLQFDLQCGAYPTVSHIEMLLMSASSVLHRSRILLRVSSFSVIAPSTPLTPDVSSQPSLFPYSMDVSAIPQTASPHDRSRSSFCYLLHHDGARLQQSSAQRHWYFHTPTALERGCLYLLFAGGDDTLCTQWIQHPVPVLESAT